MTSNTFNPLLITEDWSQNIPTPNIPINYSNNNSICTVISGLIFTIILPVFFSLFFPLMYSQSFFSLHSYLTLSVRQFALLLYLYFFSQCCYNLFSGTVFLWFPTLWLQSLSTTFHSCCLLCTSLCYRYFIRWWYPSYIHINQCYIWQHAIFVFLLCLNSHLSFLSLFCGHFLIFSCMGYR